MAQFYKISVWILSAPETPTMPCTRGRKIITLNFEKKNFHYFNWIEKVETKNCRTACFEPHSVQMVVVCTKGIKRNIMKRIDVINESPEPAYFFFWKPSASAETWGGLEQFSWQATNISSPNETSNRWDNRRPIKTVRNKNLMFGHLRMNTKVWDLISKLLDNRSRTNQFLVADKNEGINHQQPLVHRCFHQTAVIQDKRRGRAGH